ncbi:hypothetical protein BKA70DRAFT_1346277 [Coprinopsis sp. MPI-PUGE-AT-0042]|nr:hypothetical protein BKA70DRAFT_1346277 [Coprinopsis sp. MPI-PUGE-AT-0042]
MSILQDAVANELVFLVLDYVVSSPYPPYIQKTLLALAATCRRLRELVTPVVLRLQSLQLKEMMGMDLLRLDDREGNSMHAALLHSGKGPSLHFEGVASITFTIGYQRGWGLRPASRFTDLSALMKDPVEPTPWRKYNFDVDDIWAVRSLVVRSQRLKRFTLECAAEVPNNWEKSLRAVAALVDACLEHQGIVFVAEGDVFPWDREAIPLIAFNLPRSELPEYSSSARVPSNSIGNRLLHAVKRFIPRPISVPPVPPPGPPHLHLSAAALLDGPFYMHTLSIFHQFQQSLTHLYIHTASFHFSIWGPLLESCHFPVLQVFSIGAPEISLDHCLDFLVRCSSLAHFTFDTYHVVGPFWSMPKNIKPSEFLPNLKSLTAPPGQAASLLFHPRALPKLHTLTIKQSLTSSGSDYCQVLRLVRAARHRSVTPVSRLSFIFSTRRVKCEWIRETAASSLPDGQLNPRYGSLKSVTILCTHGSCRESAPPAAARSKMVLSWLEWLRQCPALETFRIDGVVRDIRVTKEGKEEEVDVLTGTRNATVAAAVHVREGVMNVLDMMWKACPRLRSFCVEGERFRRPGSITSGRDQEPKPSGVR